MENPNPNPNLPTQARDASSVNDQRATLDLSASLRFLARAITNEDSPSATCESSWPPPAPLRKPKTPSTGSGQVETSTESQNNGQQPRKTSSNAKQFIPELEDERYIAPETRRKLDNPPPAGQGLRHEWIIQVTLALVGEGWIDEEELIGLLHPKIGLDFPEREIRDAIRGALVRHPTPSPRPRAKSKPIKTKEANAPLPKKLPLPAPLKNKDVTAAISLENALKFLGTDPRFGEVDILGASHVALGDDPALDGLALLGANYKPEELLNLCIDYYIDDKDGVKLHGGGLTKTVEDWQTWIKEHKASPCKQAGCWYRHNPVKALVGTGNDGSYTNEEVSVFRYVVAESDKLPIDIQLALLARFELPIASIIDSAGKSVHAAVLTCCESFKEAQEEARRILDLLIPMGFDPQNKNSSRFSRFPGARRHKYPLGHPQAGNGEDEIRYQRLLYLAPQADGAPMFGDAIGNPNERPSMRLARQLATRLGLKYVQRQLGTLDPFKEGRDMGDA
jgi:hypothetical protein